MANAGKPTPRARHIDIKYHVLCQWVEQDLVKLERIATAQNMADIFTKILGPLLFRRHCDYIMGRVPPQYSACYAKFYAAWEEHKTRTQNDENVSAAAAASVSVRLDRFTHAWVSRFATTWSGIVGGEIHD